MKLVRDFIRDCLYSHSKGYFAITDCVLSPPAPIEFTKLLGYWSYVRKVDQLYKGKQGSWMTPVEVFQPWFSRGIASYILENHKKMKNFESMPLHLFEIGGGNGTNAHFILDYIKENSRNVYEKTSYTLIEISPAMSDRQRQLVEPAHPSRCKFVCHDFLEWDNLFANPCFVIAMEVLDNLPHDKLARKMAPFATISESENWCEYTRENKSSWYQTMVKENRETGEYEEVLEPLRDILATRAAAYYLTKQESNTSLDKTDTSITFSDFIRRPLDAMVQISRNNVYRERKLAERHDPKSKLRKVFVPTGAVKFIDILHSKFPRHHLIAADFDELPAPDLTLNTLLQSKDSPGSLLGCRNAPLVSGDNEDYPSYLHKPGTADIFFQTDFQALHNVYMKIFKSDSVYTDRISRRVDVISQKTFLTKYAEYRNTRTRNGYNPMLEDYHNTKFFLGSYSDTIG